MALQRPANGPATGLFRRNAGCYNHSVEFRILGPLEVFDEGAPVRLGGRNQRALLALLLLNVGEVVSTDRLIDGLWGEEPPRTAPTSLQNAVSQLRKLLTAERVVKSPDGLDLPALLDRIESEMGTADPVVQWTMNSTLVEIGIHFPKLRQRAIAIGEKLGIYRDYPVSKGCTSPFAPIWINFMVSRKG